MLLFVCKETNIKNATSETYCVRHCCQDTRKRAVHAEGGAVSINTKVKYENTEITDTRNYRQAKVATVAETLQGRHEKAEGFSGKVECDVQ